MLLRVVLAASLISCGVMAAGKKAAVENDPQLVAPTITVFTAEENQQIMKAWKDGRKLASGSYADIHFKESDLSSDFVKLRDAWLKVKTADQMSDLLETSYKNYDSYSPDVQYFLAQMHVARQLRGIVWRMRPLFEHGSGFLGSKSTHVTAVQFVRNIATGLKMAIPQVQTDAMIEYFTFPSKQMSKANQFSNMESFQLFLVNNYVSALNESVSRMKKIYSAHPNDVFKWDNKMIYGTGAFQDGINRIVGFGCAEMAATIGMTYESIHDALVFSAYNQNALIEVATDLGSAFGMDAIKPDLGISGLGLTDKERSAIVQKAISKKNFLKIRDSESNKYGSNLMSRAYDAKKNASEKFAEAYEMLQGKPATNAMALNPILYQEQVQNRLSEGVETAKAAVQGVKEIRDPVSGEAIKLDIPNFYAHPPVSLGELMATNWEGGSPERTVANASGEELKVRNYFYGRSIEWNNGAWKKYVPSAEGKPANYMASAKRVIHYSLGGGSVFGPIDLFIR